MKTIGTIIKKEETESSTGAQCTKITIDNGKEECMVGFWDNSPAFDYANGFQKGDSVEIEFEQKGKYNNGTKIFAYKSEVKSPAVAKIQEMNADLRDTERQRLIVRQSSIKSAVDTVAAVIGRGDLMFKEVSEITADNISKIVLLVAKEYEDWVMRHEKKD